mgnify:CR=1 FL=1
MNQNIEEIPLDRIIVPEIPMRTTVDEEKLLELGTSIKSNGLIQPVTLRKKGEMYEIVAGFRRCTASRRVGLVTIRAIVRELTDKEADSVKMHENLFREDVNPVDEARYIRQMVEVHGVEPEELARMSGKSEAYLRARYDLLDYPPYLIEAVEKEQISLTAAQWLNRITDDVIRHEYTRFAANGGITAKRAQAWHDSWKLGNLPREANTFLAPETPTSAEPIPLEMPCVLCRHKENIENMIMTYAHQDCARAVEQMQKDAEKKTAAA